MFWLTPATRQTMTGDGNCGIAPRVTVAVPSLNQGRFIERALHSILEQDVALEIFVADGGSSDETVDILGRLQNRLAGWRSLPDKGQAAAINEAVSRGAAPFVCWLNCDDRLLPGGLRRLLDALERSPNAPVAYGRVMNERRGRLRPICVEPFSTKRMAKHCIISQPGTLIRREAWHAVGGLREELVMALDYDLWWRIYQSRGTPVFVPALVAVNHDHPDTKTNRCRRLHYREAMEVVRRYNDRLPVEWWLKVPYSVWFRGAKSFLHRRWRRYQEDVTRTRKALSDLI